MTSVWREIMLGDLSVGIICSEKRTVTSENIRLIVRVIIVFVLLFVLLLVLLLVIMAHEQAKK